MDLKKFIVAVIGVFVAMLAYDFAVHELILAKPLYQHHQSILRQDTPVQWMMVGELISSVILVWVYARVRGSFSGGWKGGATFGLYVGILANFPTWIFNHLLIAGFPYSISWAWTIAGIGLGIVAGAVAGLLYNPAK